MSKENQCLESQDPVKKDSEFEVLAKKSLKHEYGPRQDVGH